MSWNCLHQNKVCGSSEFSPMLEYQFDVSPLFNTLIFNQLPLIVNGKVNLTNKSGIGV
ncbi:hypothetical protein N9835_01945 [Alphaproteobacteria bacterium]|nr:hypothetical protein [Alphaproteobacteria bacterium]